jgi:hypothetical protein
MSDRFDTLLARTEHRETAPPDRCPDADVLAAYLDATLAPSERAAVEAHAADCSRCALQLGTIVRLEDESGHPQHAPRRHWLPRLAWMVPVATAVLVAAIYVARPSDVPPATNAGGRDRVAAPIDTPAPAAELNHASPPASASDSETAPSLARKATRPPLKAGPSAVLEKPSRDTVRREQQRLEKSALEQDQFADRTPAPAAPVPAPSERRPPRTNAGGAASSMLDASPLLVVRSPDARVLWRVTGIHIERSADGGSRWTDEGPAAPHVTAGAAPSADVCWLATESGTVLRRNEAGSWLDVSPPTRASIARIESTAVLGATVVYTDGTTQTTVDGGRTWTQ